MTKVVKQKRIWDITYRESPSMVTLAHSTGDTLSEALLNIIATAKEQVEREESARGEAEGTMTEIENAVMCVTRSTRGKDND